MGNFLVIVAAEPSGDAAQGFFQAGLRLAGTLKAQASNETVETSWSRAACFKRHNGSGSPVISDPNTGSWLLVSGTWFHSDNLSCGDEARLLQRYLQVGPVQLGREVEGFFTLVIGDGPTHETIVITDVAGSNHCFLRSLPNALALSGSSLQLAGLQDFALDTVACQEFLHTGIIYQDRTLYKEVRKLGPASVFWFANGKLQKQERYWKAEELEPESLDGSKAVDSLWNSLTQAAGKVTRRFARPVCDLTGGYDSRAVVAAFLSTGTRFGTTVSGTDDSSDVAVSRTIAHFFNLPHCSFPPKDQSFEEVKQVLALTDGECDLIGYARTMAVHRNLAEQFDISINGSFGEIARGYWWELLVPRTGRPGKLNSQKLARGRYAVNKPTASLFPPEIRLQLVSHFARVIDESNAALFSTPNTFQMDHAYLTMRMQRWQGRIASSTNQLWPCLSPFMFRSVLEVMLQTRASLRKRSLLIRQMLARFQPRLAEIPLEHGYPALPATWKNLHRFRPLLNYYGKKVFQRIGLEYGSRTPGLQRAAKPARLKLWEEEQVRELLNPASMRAACLFDRDGLRIFLSQSQQEAFTTDSLWSHLLSLEYTLRMLGGRNCR